MCERWEEASHQFSNNGIRTVQIRTGVVLTPIGGALIMAAFGLGTLPMLLGMGAASTKLNQFKNNLMIRRVAGSLILLFGVLMFLGIAHPLHVYQFSNQSDYCYSPAAN